MWEIEDTPLLCSIVRWEVEGLFIHVRFSMAVNGIEQQHKLNTFNMRNLWHNLGITWKDGESCQNKITNHVHHPQTKTSLAWTCRKNGRWRHPKRPFLWRNEKRECPQLRFMDVLTHIHSCLVNTRHEEHQIPTDRWEETALDHGSWKAESGWALKQNEEETSEKTTAKRSSST